MEFFKGIFKKREDSPSVETNKNPKIKELVFTCKDIIEEEDISEILQSKDIKKALTIAFDSLVRKGWEPPKIKKFFNEKNIEIE